MQRIRPRRPASLVPLITFLGLCVLAMGGDTIRFAYLPIFMELQLGTADWFRGVVISVQSVGMLVFIPIMGVLADRFGAQRLVVVNVLLGVGANLGFMIAGSEWMLIAATLLNAAMWATLGGIGITVAQDLYPTGIGLASSLYFSAIRFSAAIGGIAGGLGVGWFGVPGVFAVPAIMCVAVRRRTSGPGPVDAPCPGHSSARRRPLKQIRQRGPVVSSTLWIRVSGARRVERQDHLARRNHDCVPSTRAGIRPSRRNSTLVHGETCRGGGRHRRGWRDRSTTSKAPHASRTAALAMWSRSIMSDGGHPGAATAEGSDGLSFTGNQNGTCANRDVEQLCLALPRPQFPLTCVAVYDEGSWQGPWRQTGTRR